MLDRNTAELIILFEDTFENMYGYSFKEDLFSNPIKMEFHDVDLYYIPCMKDSTDGVFVTCAIPIEEGGYFCFGGYTHNENFLKTS